MKKAISLILAFLLIALSASVFAVGAEEVDKGSPAAFSAGDGLYAHAINNSSDVDAWQKWQSVHDTSMYVYNSNIKYFFLPSSVQGDSIDIYNGYGSAVTLNGVSIPAFSTAEVPFTANRSYSVYAGGSSYTLYFYKSSAEAAIYINNPDADGNGTELHSYLKADKSRSASATGAIVTPDGKIDNTGIKKIKGRGNTTWYPEKKGFNITYTSKVSIAGMAKNKKYSILANFQDDSLSRNRFLYDLSDAVGLPYASDSRYVDFYIDGFYWGSYQMCEKVEAGSLVPEVDGEGYLNDDGTLKEDFGFIAEVDGSAGDEDYWFYADNGTKITLKAPEIDPGQPYYNEVKAYCKSKYDAFASAARNKNSDLTQYADLDSLVKFWMINELGKNWDSGVSSTFFTYRPDENGDYKFYGSPVWDYDNSLGNANGVSSDLSSMGVSDYTKYTGWWCMYKGKSRNESSSSNNIVNQLSVHAQVKAAAPKIWFERFVPALEHFAENSYSEKIAPEMMTRSEYLENIAGSAENNYRSGWAINTGSWIADHTSLTPASFDLETMKYSTAKSSKSYNQSNFTDMFNYAADWMLSRAAWLSNQFAGDYTEYVNALTVGDTNLDGFINIVDVTSIQKHAAKLTDPSFSEAAAADSNGDGEVDITDATLVQKYIAKLEAESNVGLTVGEAGSDPGDDPVDNPYGDTEDGYKVIFANTLGWSGTMYCYYWNGEQGIATVGWPGEEMTYLKTDEYGNELFTFFVPKWADHIIFDNGVGNYQTANIPFDASVRGFYALDSTDSRGRYQYATRDISDLA